MFRIALLLLAGLILIGLFINWFVKSPPEVVARSLRQIVVFALGAVVVGLLLIGQIIPASIMVGFIITLWRRGYLGGPGVGRFGRRSGGRRSTVRSAALEMELDHDSGDVNGRVLAGEFEGQNLDDLSETDLQRLRADLMSDADSLSLLEVYLDRRFPGWREDVDDDGAAGHAGAASSGPMTDEEAYQILGLQPGAGISDIRDAHRRLMKRLHPDMGGSSFLAAKINEAKDRLLSRHA